MDNPERSAAFLDAVLAAAVDAIVLADSEGIIVNVNPAACAMFQRQQKELVGQSVNILMPPGQSEVHDDFIRDYIDTGEKRIIGTGRDVEGMRKDGSIFPLHLSVGSASVDDMHLFVAILHDLTQRKAMQDALSRSQRLDAVGQMTGGIAHDFNNLLTVIIGDLELLEMHGSDPKAKPLIKDALDAAEMGADLTSRLMVFARRSNLKPVEADVRVLCEEALALLKRTLGADLRITTSFAPGLRPVLIDPVQLQSALVNLALNARDAMGDKGELLIAVDNVTIDDDYMAQEVDVEIGDYVRLSVSDDGAGMSPEAQRRAFEPFFTTKAESGGNGLGLAMVYGFVRQSGGHITLYSEPGHGTSFGLYFPAVPESGTLDMPQAESTTASPSLEIGQNLTVLIVEDNPKVRRLSMARVASLGFNIKEAANGDQAYAMLKEGLPVDILFSDLVMPGNLNGFELAAKVAEEFPEVRVLLTSGYASDAVSERMAKGVRYEILHKPFRQSELANRLQSLLRDDPPG